MVKNKKSKFLGTTKRLPDQRDVKKQPEKIVTGCLFSFQYHSATATDPRPFIIMISPKWTAKKGGTYFTGINLNDISVKARDTIINQFGSLPVGSVSYEDIKGVTRDPGCCVRTYNVRKVRALHKVEV
tara:strand:- start:69 stop:452 length:384 start_codon:yes stop_codon:yes gene_type:complete